MKTLLLFLISLAPICFSQTNFTFPFNTNDRWDYAAYSGSWPGPLGRMSCYFGKDSLMPNNQIYKSFAVFYFRKVGSKIYQFSPADSTEFVRYDFSKHVGDTISFIRYRRDSAAIRLIADQKDSVLGHLVRVLHFSSFNGLVGDAVADSFGISSFSFVLDGYYELAGAIISGINYGDITSVRSQHNLPPNNPSLSQNYPNPFNPSTLIQYHIPKASRVKITLTNIIGQNIAVLVDSYKQAGSYNIQWDALHFSSGIYFCIMQSDNFVKSIKLVLVK